MRAYPLVRKATSRARNLRKRSTDAESILWNLLRNRQLVGHKFRRQVPIGKYIVDFLCVAGGLIVELDGGHHKEQMSYDSERTLFLESKGYRVLRFWNSQMLEEMDAVQEAILMALNESTPSP